MYRILFCLKIHIVHTLRTSNSIITMQVMLVTLFATLACLKQNLINHSSCIPLKSKWHHSVFISASLSFQFGVKLFFSQSNFIAIRVVLIWADSWSKAWRWFYSRSTLKLALSIRCNVNFNLCCRQIVVWVNKSMVVRVEQRNCSIGFAFGVF